MDAPAPSHPCKGDSPLARTEVNRAYYAEAMADDTQIPLTAEQQLTLIRLAFAWNLSPKEALDRALYEAAARTTEDLRLTD
jgi:hypothetical protein